ncbi:MAG TPA: family 78 glycoside hydrolase catalytic domain [Capsulimonadaceae bacterium]|jgi:hypothetical protein
MTTPAARVTTLRHEYLPGFVAIDAWPPRLSWIIETSERDYLQAAYQVLVSSAPDLLNGDLWDSGKVQSSASVNVEIGCAQLPPDTLCFWNVRVWGPTGDATPWSETAVFSTGLREPDWHGAWIRYDGEYSREESPSPWFRKAFTLTAAPSRAIVYLGSAGYADLYVNGAKVGDDMLTPATSDMAKRTLYNAYNIAPLLREGANCIGIWASRGWFIETAGSEPLVPPGPRVRVRASIVAAGEPVEIVTDSSWTCSTSCYTTLGEWHFSRFGGERYDASLDRSDWSTPAFDDAAWPSAAIAPSPAPRSDAQACPRNRVSVAIPAVRCDALAEGRFKIDFGTDLTGFIEMQMPAMPAGRVVSMEYADSEGGIYNQVDEFVSGGGEGERFRTMFSFHAFRAVIVAGLPHAPQLSDVTAYLIECDLEPAGSFTCSDDLLNRIHDLHVWTLRCLDLGGHTVDCPHRERLGYGAEGQVPTETAICNLWMPAFYTKWLADWRDAQDSVTGSIPNTAPYRWGGGGPAWGGMLAATAWRLYVYYGDTRILTECAEPMQRYLDYLDTLATDDVVEPFGGKWDFIGDWVPPGRGMDTENWPSHRAASFFTSCYRVYLWQLQEQTATALGDTASASRCHERIESMRPRIHAAFYDPDAQQYVIDEQTYYVMPLLTGVVPDSLVDTVTDRLISRIVDRCDNHIDTGVLGTYFLIEYLQRTGRHDILYALATQTSYPSWGHMLAEGATTCWEQWNGHASHIHASYISLDNWFTQGLCGIRPDPAAPGFERFIIEPHFPANLTHARATYRSPYGLIESGWTRDADRIMLTVTIPPNSTATVHIPDARATTTLDGQSVASVLGASQCDSNAYCLGAGTWVFEREIG